MAKVYLITGFNNWGKTHLIKGLFSTSRFVKHKPASFAGHDFCVVPQSNDDLGQAGYIAAYNDRIASLQTNGFSVTHVVSAFCPTREPANNSMSIVNQLFHKDQVFLIPVEYKWCGHVKLQLKEISSYFSHVQNMQIHPLSQKNPDHVIQDLKLLLDPLL